MGTQPIELPIAAKIQGDVILLNTNNFKNIITFKSKENKEP